MSALLSAQQPAGEDIVMKIKFTLPLKLGRGQNDRGHWSKKYKKAKSEKDSACLMCRSTLAMAGVRPSFPAIVTMTRHSAGHLDTDNLAGAFKAVRDGIALALGIDDGGTLVEWRYDEAKVKRRDFGVSVKIEFL